MEKHTDNFLTTSQQTDEWVIGQYNYFQTVKILKGFTWSYDDGSAYTVYLDEIEEEIRKRGLIV
jgi:hypothetical protein